MVEQQINDGTVNNPQLVADAVVKLIETPKGKRPFRTVVDPGFEQFLDPYNKMLDDIQQNLLNDFGLATLFSRKCKDISNLFHICKIAIAFYFL